MDRNFRILKRKNASVDEIMEKFKLSRLTVRRTLIAMEEKNLLKSF